MSEYKITNIVVAGLGGQGVLTASDIVAEVAATAGLDVKKSELHGMSQRGGSVSSDIRFGTEVFSPMVPEGEAQFLVATSVDQVSVNTSVLSPSGVVIDPTSLKDAKLFPKRPGWLQFAIIFPSLCRKRMWPRFS
jgi:indolepyruvate ferredoxin oxidoreductase beta subunit